MNDLKDYQKVSASFKNGDSVADNFEIFVNRLDSNSKMIKSYWSNGNLQAVGFFYKGKKNGKWIMLSEDGQITFEGKYRNNIKQDSQKYYYPNAHISKIEIFGSGKIWDVFYYDSMGKPIIDHSNLIPTNK